METSKKINTEKLFSSRFFKAFTALCLSVLILAPCLFAGCAASDKGAAAPESDDASKTNVQETGVDEADIVKVNAKGEIFKAQRDGITVSLLNKTEGTIEVIKKKAAQGVTPLEMFLYDDKYLIVINAKANIGQYYYNKDFFYNFSYDTMLVNMYDLEASTGGEVKLLRSDEFRGTYKTSRLTDGNMYLVSNYTRNYGEAYIDYYDGVSDFDVTYRDDGSNSYGGYLIAKLNLNEPRGKYQTALYADKNVYDIYCSKYAFYIMKSRWYNNYRGWGCASNRVYDVDGRYFYGQITDGIDRISLDTLEREGTAEGFNGISPNRFCLYDNGEYLFVANQKMFKSDEEDSRGFGSWLYVFDKDMNEVTAFGPLAPGETMYSARYDGDIAYIVTAERTFTTVDPITFEPRQIFVDPLFKIDISNPLAPVYLGELEIEGYSTYMQSFGDGLLLGLGRGADGTELKISLFDTSGDEPAEVNSLLMANGASEAETEARAILCEPYKNIFAFAARFDVGDMAEYGTLIFGLEDGSLSRKAFLPEIYPDTDYSRKRTRRVARIGDYLLTVSDGYVVSYVLSEVLENGGADPVSIADTRINKEVLWHTVSFESDFGLSYPDRIVERGYFVTLPRPADIEGEWEFGYWAEYSVNGSVYFADSPAAWDVTLYAKWYKLPWRAVEFDINLPAGIKNGSEEAGHKYFYLPKQTVEDGGKLNAYSLYVGTLIPGYKLTHWYIDDPNNAYDFTAPVTGSFTLHAYWKSVVMYTVTFNYNFPGEISTSSSSMLYEGGTKLTKPGGSNVYYTYIGNTSVRYELDYWYKDKNEPFDFNGPATGNITLYAKWKKVSEN